MNDTLELVVAAFSAGHWSSVYEVKDKDDEDSDETVELDPEIKQHIDSLQEAISKVQLPFWAMGSWGSR